MSKTKTKYMTIKKTPSQTSQNTNTKTQKDNYTIERVNPSTYMGTENNQKFSKQRN